jgi:diacylglycerol kinase family enzyme
MRKAMLLYNPLSGRRRGRRLADVDAALSVLRSAGVEASAAPTLAASEATDQVKQAIAEGCDTVFACGGDGTVHDVLQGLVGTDAALAIIPLGTANSLAHDLRLPLSPSDAARAALTAKPHRIAVGRIEYQDFSRNRAARYFTVTVGIGVDAHLFYKLDPLAKRRFGMAAYCAKATYLWLTHKMENFAVEVGEEIAEKSQTRDDLRLVLFHTHSRVAYLRYVLRGLFGTKWKVSGIELAYSKAAICRDVVSSTEHESQPRIFVEADGELLGTLPAEISIVRDALTLLVPAACHKENP